MSEQTVLPVADPVAELPPVQTAPKGAPWAVQVVTLLAITLPLLGVIAAPFFLWDWGFHWTDLGLLLGMYVLTALGITVGFHRLFVHRSFETYTWVKFVWAVLGSMAVQGSLLKWVAMHRRHHQHSDTPDDPHSPQHEGEASSACCEASGTPISAGSSWPTRQISIVTSKTSVRAAPCEWRAISSRCGWSSACVIPAILGGVITLSWAGVWTGLVWGGLVRVFLVHHVTWSVNSACHLWGFRPYRSDDQSRNNILFGILAMGEGWHNTHHAFPTSARHGLRWWQIDVSYWVIRTLALLGLAWNLKLPTKQAQAKERRVS